MSKPILCLDFDGVLHSYSSGWQGARQILDPPVAGALDFLVNAIREYEVAIYSSRSRYWGGRRAIKSWLMRELVEWRWSRVIEPTPRNFIFYGNSQSPAYTATDMEDGFRDWARQVIACVSFPRWKPAAFVTLDDRAITFNGTWPDLATLKSFKPWNKK